MHFPRLKLFQIRGDLSHRRDSAHSGAGFVSEVLNDISAKSGEEGNKNVSRGNTVNICCIEQVGDALLCSVAEVFADSLSVLVHKHCGVGLDAFLSSDLLVVFGRHVYGRQLCLIQGNVRIELSIVHEV